MDNVLLNIDHHGVATLTLNREEKHNAFDDAIVAELMAKLKQVEADPAVRVVVLTAVGKTFSAGGDLGWMRSMAQYSEKQNLEDA
ncbi:MAG TPA: enoyl-CoA hydratase-related protein, partial [Gammaproteobacteria bacterium]|nr:enoyl-CoA hydratase-related protein [Gammaproteobacteria bacterium]